MSSRENLIVIIAVIAITAIIYIAVNWWLLKPSCPVLPLWPLCPEKTCPECPKIEKYDNNNQYVCDYTKISSLASPQLFLDAGFDWNNIPDLYQINLNGTGNGKDYGTRPTDRHYDNKLCNSGEGLSYDGNCFCVKLPDDTKFPTYKNTYVPRCQNGYHHVEYEYENDKYVWKRDGKNGKLFCEKDTTTTSPTTSSPTTPASTTQASTAKPTTTPAPTSTTAKPTTTPAPTSTTAKPRYEIRQYITDDFTSCAPKKGYDPLKYRWGGNTNTVQYLFETGTTNIKSGPKIINTTTNDDKYSCNLPTPINRSYGVIVGYTNDSKYLE